jgi:nitroreductase
MKFAEVVEARRSVKHYDPDHTMSDAEVHELLNSTLLSPTSFNIQHWRFVRVSDKALRADIRAVAWDQAQITDASELFVIAADIKAWEKSPERYWQNVDSDTQDFLVNMIGEFYNGREWIQRDEAIRSGGIASQTLMLTAKSMGYDSCPMIGFDQEKVAELIKLPDDHILVMLIAVGKAKTDAYPRGGQLDLSEVLINNTF